MADHLRQLLTGTSLSWASDAAVPTTERSTPPVVAVPPRCGRRARAMGSPPTSRADTPDVSCRACTPVTSGGRAEVAAAAAARSAFRAVFEVLSRLAPARAQGRGPGFGSSSRTTGKGAGAAHT